jgi:hypothetical protein
MGFLAIKNKVITALVDGTYSHEARGQAIDEKNKLATGEVTPAFVANIIKRSTGSDYSCSPHHQAPTVDVHVITKSNWYVKFYFLEPDAVFISVHE